MSDLFLLRNSEIIDLFEIKISDFEGYFRFHGSKNFDKDLIFKSVVYIYIPCELSNLEYSSEGKQNRPVLTVSNINNFISNFIKDRNDLLGCRFFRKKILAKDLDDVNFGGADKNTLGSPSFSSYISNDTYIIQKKNAEQKDKVDFLLANVLDIDGLVVPSRKIFNDACQWQYRGCGCNYGKINGYDGPSWVTRKFSYKTLQDVHATFTNLGAIPSSNTGDLVAWFKPEGRVIIGQTYFNREANARLIGVGRNQTWMYDKYQVSAAKVTSWTNSSGYSPASPSLPVTMTFTGTPKALTSAYCSIDNVFFMAADSMTIQNLDFTSSGLNSDCTIFYVSSMKNTSNWALQKREGLAGGLGYDFVLGYSSSGHEDYFRTNTGANNEINFNNVNKTSSENRIYAAVVPKNHTVEDTIFYKNGVEITRKTTTAAPNAKNFGFNIFGGAKSEMIINEIIMYKRALTKQEIMAVSTYLASKYKIPTPYVLDSQETKQSKDYFTQFSNEGNLGVPMADSNNKVFLKNQQQLNFVNYESYDLENLNYMGDYNKNTQYGKGDFVRLNPSLNYDFNQKSIANSSDSTAKFFVCVEDGIKALNPLYNTKVWKEDKCSKNLNGCLLRFGNSNVNIPFGGFPGTVGYDYRLPG